jgi:hypothetical protein
MGTRPRTINEGFKVDNVAAGQVTASGDGIILAAASGVMYKILRVEASNSHASTAPVVGLKIASINSGSTFGKRYLPAVGGLGIWTFPGGYLLTAANEAVNINLSAGSAAVEWTVYYDTIAV